MFLSIVMLIWGSKNLILMVGMYVIGAILKVHVCFLKHKHSIDLIVIFILYITHIEVKGVHIDEFQNGIVLPLNNARESI